MSSIHWKRRDSCPLVDGTSRLNQLDFESNCTATMYCNNAIAAFKPCKSFSSPPRLPNGSYLARSSLAPAVESPIEISFVYCFIPKSFLSAHQNIPWHSQPVIFLAHSESSCALHTASTVLQDQGKTVDHDVQNETDLVIPQWLQ